MNMYKNKMFALILDNKVVDITQNKFPAAKPMKWIECDNEVKVGYFFINKKFKSSLKSDAEIVKQKIDEKISQIEFYYDSTQIKTTTVNIRGKDYQLINDQKLRNLLFLKINILEKKISQNLIKQEDAKFSFEINETTQIDLNIDELWQTLLFLDTDRQTKFKECQNHQKNIRALNNKDKIEEYKFN
jgi:hypothetical protein